MWRWSASWNVTKPRTQNARVYWLGSLPRPRLAVRRGELAMAGTGGKAVLVFRLLPWPADREGPGDEMLSYGIADPIRLGWLIRQREIGSSENAVELWESVTLCQSVVLSSQFPLDVHLASASLSPMSKLVSRFCLFRSYPAHPLYSLFILSPALTASLLKVMLRIKQCFYPPSLVSASRQPRKTKLWEWSSPTATI